MQRQTRYVAYKRWGNAWAFIVLEGRQISVIGCIYTSDNRFRKGPSVTIGEIPDDELFNEIHERSCMYDTKSPKLEAYVQQVWQQAKETEPWYNYQLEK